MDKKKISILIVASAITGFLVSKNILFKKTDMKPLSTAKVGNAQFYWTCPMHPQIHADHPGECPICHMKLVKVASPSSEQTEKNAKGDKRNPVVFSAVQSELLSIHKYEVEKMNLRAVVPISGRVLSSSAVALQVYEDELRYIRPGLSFKGEAGVYSEQEISGMISSVDTIADPSSRTVRVVGSIKKGPRSLISETSFRGEIELELSDRVAIPESSVLHTGTGDLVYIFNDGNKLTAKPVKLGMKAEGFYEVLDGLSVGDSISSGPNFLIDSEAKIRGASQ